MDQTIIPVESILERDLDLLLLEEFNVNEQFCRWFTQELGLPDFNEMNIAWRSITAFGLGETDILFSYGSEQGKVYVLIENKLDASFQDAQFERYSKRAAKYIQEKDCEIAFSILIAPEVYCINQSEFELYLSYEQIAKQLAHFGDKRSLFKCDLLNIASEKLRRGYQPVNSEPVQQFWLNYWNYKEEHFPSLSMKKPGIVPHNSDWPMIYDDELKGITFYHKLAQGNVDATFKGNDEETVLEITRKLPAEMTLVQHAKSFSIRLFTGKIDRTKDFHSQFEYVEKGLKGMNQLREWIKVNISYFT